MILRSRKALWRYNGMSGPPQPPCTQLPPDDSILMTLDAAWALTLLARGAGVHVRFRLGGSCFPPLLFYKIFTHRPVADVGAFGPRNYSCEALLPASALFNKPAPAVKTTRAAAQPAAVSPGQTTAMHKPRSCMAAEADFEIPEAYQRFVRPDGSVGTRSMRGWYQRCENNGWRPINEVRMVDSEDQLGRGAKQRPAFHFAPAERRRERARRRKLRRREWMLSLYRYASARRIAWLAPVQPMRHCVLKESVQVCVPALRTH
jgi:hypothetical protein